MAKNELKSCSFYGDKPTEKQIKYIQSIENALNIKFEGTTKRDAWQFIADNVDDFNEVVRMHRFIASMDYLINLCEHVYEQIEDDHDREEIEYGEDPYHGFRLDGY